MTKSQKKNDNNYAVEVLIKNWELIEQDIVRTDNRIMSLISIGFIPLVVGWSYCILFIEYRTLILAFPFIEQVGLVILISIGQRYLITSKLSRRLESLINSKLKEDLLIHRNAYDMFFVTGFSFTAISIVILSVILISLIVISGPMINLELNNMINSSWYVSYRDSFYILRKFDLHTVYWASHWLFWISIITGFIVSFVLRKEMKSLKDLTRI